MRLRLYERWSPEEAMPQISEFHVQAPSEASRPVPAVCSRETDESRLCRREASPTVIRLGGIDGRGLGYRHDRRYH
jgi:hypothetical protein